MFEKLREVMNRENKNFIVVKKLKQRCFCILPECETPPPTACDLEAIIDSIGVSKPKNNRIYQNNPLSEFYRFFGCLHNLKVFQVKKILKMHTGKRGTSVKQRPKLTKCKQMDK